MEWGRSNIQRNRIFPNLLKNSNPEMKPHNPKQYKNADIDVSKRAQSFGGGGHVRAAGCTIYSSIEDAKKQIVDAVVKVVQGEVNE